MKQILLKFSLIFFLLLSAFCGVLLYNYRIYSPFDPSFHTIYPKRALSNDEIYVITDNGDRRIIALDKTGKVYSVYNGGIRSNHGFYTTRVLSILDKDRFIILNNIIYQGEETIRTQRINILNKGKTEKTLIDFSYTDEELKDLDYHVFFSQYYNGHIFVLIPDKLNKAQSILYDITLNGSVTTTIIAFDVLEYADISIRSATDIVCINKNGTLFKYNEQANMNISLENKTNNIFKPISLLRDTSDTIIILDSKNSIHFLDSNGIFINSIHSNKSGFERFSIKFASISPHGNIIGTNEYTKGMINFGISEKKFINRFTISAHFRLFSLLYYLSCICTLILIFVFLFYFYFTTLKRKIPLIIKQMFIFIPLILFSFGLTFKWVYQDIQQNLETEINKKLLILSQIGVNGIDAERFKNCNLKKIQIGTFFSGTEYRYFENYINSIINNNENWWNMNTYCYLYKIIDNEFYVLGALDYTELYPSVIPEFYQVINEGKIVTTTYSDVYGRWYSALMPIKDKNGIVTGIFEATMSDITLEEYRQQYLSRIIVGVLFSLSLLLVALGFFTYILLLSLKSLKNGAERVSEGDYSLDVTIHSNDELGDLGNAFNKMTGLVRLTVDQIVQLNKAYAKFVPNEFLHFLGKKSILDIKLGNQTHRTMTILFSDIRLFTTLSEKMTPEENFSFLNEYFHRMGPVIRIHNGFIDKYIGDAIMALFPASPTNAVDSALEIITRLTIFNEEFVQNTEEKINIGIGIHTGEVMMGIIGEEERFEGTVISDAVNFASRLEGLTKQYNISIIISEDTYQQLPKEKYRIRFLNLVRVLGKAKAKKIYEVIHPQDPLGDNKIKNNELYIKGFDLFRTGDFKNAKEIFNSIYNENHQDRSCENMIKLCKRMGSQPIPENWDGVIELRDK